MHRPVLIMLVALCAVSAAGPGLAAVSVYMTPEDLAERSQVVVQGTVVAVDSGMDPASGRLATYVRLDVDRVLRGPGDLTSLVLREPGGVFGAIAHDVDAVPDYRPGETVVAFLQATRDGALRTTGMFFGKFTLENETAVRDLDGRGRIRGRPTARPERFDTRDLTATVAARPTALANAWRAEPAELHDLLWDGRSATPVVPGTAASGDDPITRFGARSGSDLTAAPDFGSLSSTAPARWYGVDTDGAVTFDVDPAGHPLGTDAGAVDAIQRAMEAWNQVPESRLVLATGDVSVDFPARNPTSPAASYPPTNVVLFDDPYDDISDPNGCAGVLAIGGYWRSGSQGSSVNNVTYHRALRGYVIFNNGFSCFLGDADDLAEVATHELGHALGFGHSTVSDAIMRSSAYGNGRGPRLGDDDRDAAHCVYPHTVTLTAPDGGGTVLVGDVVDVRWSISTETAGGPGTVDVLHSEDGGATWNPLATGIANDGMWSWTAAGQPGPDHRIRVDRPNRVSPTPAPFPTSCSGDESDVGFTLAAPAPIAGVVSDGTSGAPLTLARSGDDLVLSWSESCSGLATSYAIYEGSLAALRDGVWSPFPLTCAGSTSGTQAVTPGPGDTYYLVAPLTAGAEGGMGFDGGGVPRGLPEPSCAPREAESTCP